MVVSNNPQRRKIYIHTSTSNKSFLDMHYYLKDKGIKNNSFMLVLYDKDLYNINPYDPKLNAFMKQKVLRECIINPWYFFREVIRIPETGIATGVKFGLHRGNLAFLFCKMLNLNIYLEQPRQTGKTIVALAWYLYCFNFGTSNSNISLLNKKMEDSKRNLSTIRDIRDLLPSYLRLDQTYAFDGTKKKPVTRAETIAHPINGNKLLALPSARNKVSAASLLRGRTTDNIYIDEYGFILYNKIIYLNMVPAFNTAANNSKKNNKLHGIVLTSTPGFLNTDEGKDAFNKINNATRFSEDWYDYSYSQLMEILLANTNSSFVYIKYYYNQLGKDEQWFKNICIDMEREWADIRREVLLEWASISENSPFKKEDLNIAQSLVRPPIESILLLNKYTVNIYERVNLNKHPPIIGVDASGGFNGDSSAITIIDSATTRVIADLNCNYISTIDLAKVIYELVTRYMPRAIVNIERNGGYGDSVLKHLINTKIKNNLYFEIQDRVLEERSNGIHISRKKQKVKVYGSTSTKEKRNILMELLRERMEFHKDKIVSPIIMEELKTLEVKRNGKIEHSSNSHDDSVFSWLWALYVYYYGVNTLETYGLIKQEILTDQSLEESYIPLEEKLDTIIDEIAILDNEMVQTQLQQLQAKSQSYTEWENSEAAKDKEALLNILQTKEGMEAYARINHTDEESIRNSMDMYNTYTIPDKVFINFYDDE